MDKIVKIDNISLTTPASNDWAQGSLVLVDNSGNTVDRTIKSFSLKGTVLVSPGSANQKSAYYYALVYVTNTDGVLPNFAGTMANLNTQMNQYRKNIWLTDSGWIRADSGRSDDVITEFEPSTSRKLLPGQKVYLVLLACYGDSGAAVAVSIANLLDIVVFYE
jgi:hypothetical protein